MREGKDGEEIGDLPSYQELENTVLNAVTAIHCLTAERNNLRKSVEAQESQLANLRYANEHLRRQILLIGDSYIKYASSCANSLQDVAQAMDAAKQTDGGETSTAA